MSDKQYTMTLFEACEFLSVGKRTVSRLVKDKKIMPQKERTPQGLWAYRFNKDDLIAYRENRKLGADMPLSDTISQDQPRQDKTQDRTGQEMPNTEKEDKPIVIENKTDDTPRQDRSATRQDKTGQDEIIGILKQDKRELKEDFRTEKKRHTKDLQAKDQQIHHLISSHDKQMERKDILLKGLQDRILTLEAPSKQGQGIEQIEQGTVITEEKQPADPSKKGQKRSDLPVEQADDKVVDISENIGNDKPVKTDNNRDKQVKKIDKIDKKTVKRKSKKIVDNRGNKKRDTTGQDKTEQAKPVKKGFFKKIFG